MNYNSGYLPSPVPPQSLIEACVNGDCVLFASTGLSARAGRPTYRPFVKGLLDWSLNSKVVEWAAADSHRTAIEKGDGASVADAICDALGERREPLYNYLRETFLYFSSSALSDAHLILGDIDFSGVLTVNLDDLLERTYEHRGNRVYTPQDTESLRETLHKRDFFILKLYGDLQRPETVVISTTQFEDAVSSNLPFLSFMETLFFSKTMLFIGTSLERIEDYLKSIYLKKQSNPRPHYALVAVGDDGWQAKAQSLEKRYGIVTLPYNSEPEHAQFPKFLKSLAREVEGRTTKTSAALELERNTNVQLSSIRLENIGPFDSLDLELDSRWNILLGDNGVGKSSILKAIGVAICGKDAQGYAGRIIKAGKTHGAVTLTTKRGNQYVTKLFATSSGPAELESVPGRPLEAEGWLALGFPPLRTVSWDRPRAPETVAKALPTADDLLPLIKGVPDPRLDKLKQWIVNLDYRSKNEQVETGSNGGRYEKLLSEFFQIFGRLTEGVKIERGKVNPNTNEVTVMTDDGELPIEAISQGMTSLIGWVGILLQRLYEVYSDDEDPKQRYALVLMDEIDAHLHPGWQRTLVRDLSEIFPNAQFIATTHSPLIVADMPAEQVFRFERDEDGRVVQLEVEADMMTGRTDQILTSELFSLPTTFGTTTEARITRYQELLGKNSRDEGEESEFRQLTQEIRFRIPLSEGNRPARQMEKMHEEAHMRVLEQASAAIQDDFPEDSRNILERVRNLRSEY